MSRSRIVTGRPVPDEMTRSRKKMDQKVSRRSRSTALCSCSSEVMSQLCSECRSAGTGAWPLFGSVLTSFGVMPLRPSYFKPSSVCMPRSCAIRIAIPRYIQRPLSRLAPNSSYASNSAAWTTATFGHGKASGMFDFARWAKACPASGCCVLVLSSVHSFCWFPPRVSMGWVENRAASAQTASTRMASTCFSSRSRMKRSRWRKGKQQPRLTKNSLQR